MSKNIYEVLNDIICLIKCGTEQGTAFLIGRKHAITAFHVINNGGMEAVTLLINKNVISAKYIDYDNLTKNH